MSSKRQFSFLSLFEIALVRIGNSSGSTLSFFYLAKRTFCADFIMVEILAGNERKHTGTFRPIFVEWIPEFLLWHIFLFTSDCLGNNWNCKVRLFGVCSNIVIWCYQTHFGRIILPSHSLLDITHWSSHKNYYSGMGPVAHPHCSAYKTTARILSYEFILDDVSD